MTRPSRAGDEAADLEWMGEAIRVGETSRLIAPPNPWVGCLVVPSGDGPVAEGATLPVGQSHAERVALALAGTDARGATVYVTLEPCSHHGRTPPCTDALIAAGVRRVVVAQLDPDPRVSGGGVAALRAAGVEVDVGVGEAQAEVSLRPYLVQRRTGRPWVILKMAQTLDGRTAAPDRSSQWITGSAARADVQRLRAESGAIVVGSGTVAADQPSLTVRDPAFAGLGLVPLRVVLGRVPDGAGLEADIEHRGSPEELLDLLGRMGVVQVLVEGGAHVAHDLLARDLVDRMVVYTAPALLGGDDGLALLAGPGAPTMAQVRRARFGEVRRLGDDLRIDLELRD